MLIYTCTHYKVYLNLYRREEVGGSLQKLPGSGSPEGGPEPDYIAYVFAFLRSIAICRLDTLTISDQDQVTLKLRASLSDLLSSVSAVRPCLGRTGGGGGWGAQTGSRRPWVRVKPRVQKSLAVGHPGH
jgi:hypothetical protein